MKNDGRSFALLFWCQNRWEGFDLGALNALGTPQRETLIFDELHRVSLVAKELLRVVCFLDEFRAVDKVGSVGELGEMCDCWNGVVHREKEGGQTELREGHS